MNLGHLYEFCTVRQLEVVQAIEKAGSIRGGAKALGLNYTSALQHLDLAKKKAAKQLPTMHDYSKRVPDGFGIKGLSQYIDKDGKVAGQWVKSSIDQEKQAEFQRAMLEALSSEVKGLGPVVPGPKHVLDDLMCIIPVGDPHFGLYVWAQECGADFDTEIAKKLSIAAADRLIASAPDCSVGVLLLLGDITHANDQTNATPAHKHQLDVDSRFVRVIGITVETWRHIILRMKQKFGKVVGKLLPGNHDPQAVWALSYALHAYFSNDPCVEIDLGPSKFWYYQFGKVLIGSTHGDTIKPERLPAIMAADKPKEWGETTHRHWYTGHIHSKNTMEFPGVLWESFRTLAPADSYATQYGYRSGRDMVAIIHHREHGEIERHRCDVGMIS